MHITPANVNDFEVYVDRIKHQLNIYNFSICEVGLDKGYDYTEVHKEMYDLGIKTYIPLKDTEKSSKDKIYPPSVFIYNKNKDAYICPNNCILSYSSLDKSSRAKVYLASQKDCKICPVKHMCVSDKIKCRKLKISLFKEEIDLQHSNYGTKRYFEVQNKRRTFCEGNFALQKDNHNLRRTRKRGYANVAEHCFCSALVLNLKRLMKHLKRKGCSLEEFKSIYVLSLTRNQKEHLPDIKCSFCVFVNKPGWTRYYLTVAD